MTKKIFYIVFIVLFAFFSTCTPVQATRIKNTTEGAQEFLNEGKNEANDAINADILSDTSSLIYNTILIVGTCIAVAVAAILGVLFITGSVEQKVKVKESLLVFIVGCVLLFGGYGIWRLVITILK